jgi:23S rRNA pseudouridine1911/1915/1917 synthase
MSVDVLFEDNHLLIVDKPAGLVTQPSNEHGDSLETRAKLYIKKHYHKPGSVFLHAVHRLDKEVAGIVIFARTSKALSRMNALIREGKLLKIYRASLEGHIAHKKQMLCDFLVKKPHHAECSSSDEEGAKKSTLSYQVMQEGAEGSIVEIELETGRYHQIRVQMSAQGYPILGDKKYGSTKKYRDGQIALSHVRVEFQHPVLQTLVKIVSRH